MIYTESEYIDAGYKFERAKSANDAIAQSQRIRIMLEREHITDHVEARRLVDQGRQEARRAMT